MKEPLALGPREPRRIVSAKFLEFEEMASFWSRYSKSEFRFAFPVKFYDRITTSHNFSKHGEMTIYHF
jgi:hypothetical protein